MNRFCIRLIGFGILSLFYLVLLCGYQALQDDNVTQSMNRVLMKLRDKVSPAVVALLVEREKDKEGRDIDPQGQTPPKGKKTLTDYYRRPKGPCTGTIFESDGYILTSYFNVSGKLKKITVATGDGQRYEAKLLGYDQPKDIALLKIEATGLPTLEVGATQHLKPGDFSAVIGRGPELERPTINQGIISALTRFKGSALQADAEMNYGNVGGPLVDFHGRLLGITSHIIARSHWGQSSGVGFATKIEEIQKVLPQLKKGENVEKEKEPWLGVVLAEGEEDIGGARIAQVQADSPAEAAGLKVGDIIQSIDGKKVADADDVVKIIGDKKVGDEVTIRYKRKIAEGEEDVKDVKVKLEEKP